MRTFEEIHNEFITAYNQQKAERDEIENQAKKAREAALRYYRIAAQKMSEYYRLSSKSWHHGDVHWVTHQVIPLLKEINERTGLDFDYSNLNTFGLGCECPVFTKSDNESKSAFLTFTPSFSDEHRLYIYTGETTNRYAVGSIGELNGGNEVQEEVVSVETVIENLRRRFPKLELSQSAGGGREL